MKELTPDEPNDFPLARDQAGSPQFRVLVADDDEMDRRLTIWHLGKARPVERDMMVECAADGAEALEQICNNRYALVVLDWNMPLQHGAEVLREIREKGLRVPVVVVSGQPREAIAHEVESMAATFVNKDELDPGSFRSAIAASIQLQDEPGAIESSR